MFCPKEVGSNMNERYFSLDMAEIPSRSVLALRSLVMVLMKGFSLLMSEVEVCQAHLPNPTLPKIPFPPMQIIQ